MSGIGLPRLVEKLKGLAISSAEIVLAVALVLVFALVFIGILTASFPRGTGLVDTYEQLIESDSRGSELRWRTPGDDAPFIAVLSHVRRRVRDRSAEAISWRDARAGTRLANHHTIQTLDRSAASISIGDDGELRLGERSLMVVKREDRPRGLRRRRSSVVLLGGAVEGVLEPGRRRSSRLDVVTAGGTAELRSRGRQGTEFKVAVNPDESSTVSIYSGVAEIATASGSKKVGPNEAVMYDPDGFIGPVLPIPDAPEPLSPADGAIRTYGAVSPRVHMRWSEPKDVDAYGLVLARDPEFDDVVYQGKLARPEFVHGNLTDGPYYWRVRSVSGHVESRFSDARGFRLVRDLDPPELRVDLPQGVVTTRELVLRGTAEPGSELYVDNESVPLGAGGEFRYALTLKPGINMIVIEAVDMAGNSTYRAQYVTARF